MRTLSVDLETFSSTNLAKAGSYRYAQAPDFEILLFGYSVDSGPVQVVDLVSGEKIPARFEQPLRQADKWGIMHLNVCACRDISVAGRRIP